MAAKKTNKKTKKKVSKTQNISQSLDPKKSPLVSIITLASLILIIILVLFSDKIFHSDPNNQVIAKVNGEKIRLSQLHSEYHMLPAEMKSQLDEGKMLSLMIDQVILLQEAQKKGYTADSYEAYAIIRQSIIYTGLTEEDFFKMLGQFNLTKEYLMAFYSKQIMINKLLNETILSQLDVTDEEAEEYFSENKNRFLIVPELKNVSHILLKIKNTEDQSELSQVQNKIKDLMTKVDKNNFAEFAEDFSEDISSSENGGYLGLVQKLWAKNVYGEEFGDLLFSVPEDQLVGPIRSKYGYHILYVYNTIAEEYMPLDAAKEDLKKIKQQDLYKEYMAELKSLAEVERFIEEKEVIVSGTKSFIERGTDICTENGKPFVAMYSTSTCEHSKWSGPLFDETARLYAGLGKASVHHYELDSGDDLLTDVKETKINDEHLKIFEQYSPSKDVPLFVFGCKYVRKGNSFEMIGDKELEINEFKTVFDLLT